MVVSKGEDDRRVRSLVFSGRSAFLANVRERVDAALEGKAAAGDARLHRKAMFIAVWFVGSYTALLLIDNAWMQLVLCVSFAFAASALAFNVFHDANHESFFVSRRANRILAITTCTVLGAARHFWRQKHHVLHHTYPNVYKWDDDVESRGFLRLSPRQPWHPRFRGQHFFFGFLYAFNSLEWFFVKDFVQYVRGRVNPHQAAPPMSVWDHVEFWASKAIYFGIFVVLPFALFPAERVIVGLLVFHATFSITLTFVFQLAHLTDEVAFPIPAGNAIDDDWAAHQLRTTANFATDNWLANWFTGGLNHQIEHHLFPHISHTHYPDIAPIVQRTADEFGLPYHSFPRVLDAVSGHYRMVRDLSVEPEPAGVPG